MRLVFIHGFGENESVFDGIRADLPGEHLCIDLWEALGTNKRPDLGWLDFCQELITKYRILQDDWIIGHSLGGKLAFGLKHLMGNSIVQIASWTDQNKTILPINSPSLLLWMAKNRLMFNAPIKRYLLSMYNRPDTKVYYSEAYDRLIRESLNCSVNQFRLILEAIPETVSVQPDLRIHARRDNIVRFPDEACHEVPGDHFCLITHPKEVSAAINSMGDFQSA